ncbi:cytochrome c maturation protein CcmE [Actinophytocola glycyrrhizae]|uniref:Cytochrome c maturation protein CcmE n=1 Tax=Actinophytocola glycyrrhizae TaxID=2044873 RepID=A0ABV9SC99_9PSEU
MSPPVPRRRGVVLLVGAVVIAGVGLLVGAGLHDTLVYYRTPTEVVTSPPGAERVRLGGQVVPGSVSGDGEDTRFLLTDGKNEVPVVQRGAIPGTFREGEGAVVEGTLDARGTFRSDTLTVKHSNEYRAPGDERGGNPAEAGVP